MSKTVQEIQSWLLSPDALKVILVEITEVNKTTNLNVTDTIYLSSRPYISEAGVNYNPCIVGGVSYSESLNFENNASLNYGDIEIDNTDGSNDEYLTYHWKNRPVSIYIGDARWPRTDFSLVFKGIISNILVRSRGSINFGLLDTMARLNVALSETTYQYTGSVGNIITSYQGSNTRREGLEDTLKPITFGECFNISPIQVAAGYWYAGSMYGTLYQFHNGKSERVIEVRDNGALVDDYESAIVIGPSPPAPTYPINNGCLFLINSSYGTITASVQGGYIGSTYSSNLFPVIRNILTNYGGEYKVLDTAIDFPAYIGSNNPYVGYYCTDRENVLDVCNKLASSAGYQLVNNTVTAYVGSATNVAAEGKLKLVRIDLQNVTPIYTITDDDMVLNTLHISDTVPVKSSIKLAYCKNWTPLTNNLAEAVAPLTVSYFKDEWLDHRYTSSNSKALYRDSTEPIVEETYLIDIDDATNELNRRAALFGTQRFIVSATYLPNMFFAQLGDGVQFNLYDSKYNSILNGKVGIIFSINRDWLKNTIEIGVLI
jgi:hypothetical protein